MEIAQKEFLTLSEVQALLGAGKTFVFKHTKGLTKYKIGNKSYLKQEDIKTLFQPKEKSLSA